MSGGMSVVEGPLEGYHHETYVLWLPDGGGRVKVRAPRSEVLWFDRRCFRSEEELLRSVRPYLPQVPEVLDVGGVDVQRFIEGRTLGACRRPGRRVPEPVLEQITALFRAMAAIGPGMVTAPRRCSPEDAPQDGDSDGFLRRLIVFVQDQVYERNRAEFAGLFRDLGVVAGWRRTSPGSRTARSACCTPISTGRTSSSTPAAGCGPSTGSWR
jgi:hypothetical protein